MIAHLNPEKLAREYGTIVFRMAHRMISNRELAAEAAQETWFEVLKNLNQFKGESKISTWIYAIAKRVIFRYAQSEQLYKTHEINSHFDLEPIEYEGSETDKKEWVKEKCDHCLTAFCHCLATEARMIFVFREIAEIDFSEIAQIMQTSEENVRKILSRSRQKVRSFMEKDCILFNPRGNCRCRIKQQIRDIDLQKEYDSLAKTAQLAAFYKKFDNDLPRKNYWKKFFS